jgi:5'-3' exoribonuclease 1
MSALTLSKITSGLMIEVANGQRINAGLNLKFEARSQKVLGYAQRNERGWEYSQKAIDLITEYKSKFPEIVSALDGKSNDLTKAADFFPTNTEARMTELKEWIKEKGVRDFEKVSLYSDQMEKEAVQDVEQLQTKLYAAKDPATMKIALVRNLPRRAVIKPEHTSSRLQHQHFNVGDRIITVQETGSVPLAVRGTVVGIQAGFIDCVFDIPFLGGTTLNGR